MELEITKKEMNPLMSRIEIVGVALSDVTPSNNDVKKEIADKLNKGQELIVVKSIYQKYGEPKSSIRAFVYENEESLKRFEKKKEVKKEEKKSAEKTEEQKK